MTGTSWSLMAGDGQGSSAAWISGLARAGNQGLAGSRSLARGWAGAVAGRRTPVARWRRGLGSGCWRLLRPANRGLGPRAWAPCLNAWGRGRVGVEPWSKDYQKKENREAGAARGPAWVAASAPVGTGNFLGFRGPRARFPPKASAQPRLSTCSSPRRRGHSREAETETPNAG